MSSSLQELQDQLKGVQDLLAAQGDPQDAQLLALQTDLQELIALTAKQEEEKESQQASVGEEEDKEEEEEEEKASSSAAPVAASSQDVAPEATAAAATSSTDPPPSKKRKKQDNKSKLPDTFQVPDHLQPQEGDSEKDLQRKQRAVKQLRRKFKDQQRDQRQKSWQSFQQKKGKGKSKNSQFSTDHSDSQDRVGVVSKHSHTGFDARKRHTY